MQRDKSGLPAIKGLSDEGSQFLGRIRAAALLDINPQTIDRFIQRGKLRAFRVGRRVLVRRDELLQLVEANEI